MEVKDFKVGMRVRAVVNSDYFIVGEEGTVAISSESVRRTHGTLGRFVVLFDRVQRGRCSYWYRLYPELDRPGYRSRMFSARPDQVVLIPITTAEAIFVE